MQCSMTACFCCDFVDSSWLSLPGRITRIWKSGPHQILRDTATRLSLAKRTVKSQLVNCTEAEAGCDQRSRNLQCFGAFSVIRRHPKSSSSSLPSPSVFTAADISFLNACPPNTWAPLTVLNLPAAPRLCCFSCEKEQREHRCSLDALVPASFAATSFCTAYEKKGTDYDIMNHESSTTINYQLMEYYDTIRFDMT